ncbi:DinB family protein [Nocardiopsis potens]|uniref:DinB family protein n=1 Tax=Nocardiopsis potens TaxID=1246458 RepID=UPI0004762289|nr:DinB family protein [Nocardiopsis potens]
MSTVRAELLTGQLDIAWALFEHHFADIDDAACLWEPAPGAWTVRPDAEGRWRPDWQVPEPDPVPALTIGWLTWHMDYWWTTTIGHCLHGGAPDREEITWPGGAAAAAERLHGLKEEWRAGLLALSDADLDSADRTAGLPWGEGLPLSAVAGWLNIELAKNVAEIGMVHHLYRLHPSG